MDLFYNPQLSKTPSSLKFQGEEFHHITRVLRYDIGQELFITNGKGLIAKAKLIKISKSECECEIINIESFIPSEKKILALLPILRNQERFEFALEKLTELGVTEIVPYYSERTVKKNYRKDRAQKILISAIKQSFNPYLPDLSELISFKDFFNSIHPDNLILFGKPDGKLLINLKDSININYYKNFIITVGPEGDFTESELNLLNAKGGIAVNLGGNRLRSETAIICLLSQLKMLIAF